MAALARKDSGGYFHSFDGTKIYYEQNSQGTAIVLVPGFIVNGESKNNTSLRGFFGSSGRLLK